jgi:hypothetical protein
MTLEKEIEKRIQKHRNSIKWCDNEESIHRYECMIEELQWTLKQVEKCKDTSHPPSLESSVESS